jgi:hypothetical protein
VAILQQILDLPIRLQQELMSLVAKGHLQAVVLCSLGSSTLIAQQKMCLLAATNQATRIIHLLSLALMFVRFRLSIPTTQETV